MRRSSEGTAMKLVMVKVTDLKEKYNPRADFSRVDDIARSIEEMGLIHPIAAREVGDKYEVVDGHQRLAALKKLGQKETQVVVLDFEKDADAAEAQMVANLMRANLNMIEKARGFEHLMKEKVKYNEKTISRLFAIKETDVKFLLSLAQKLDPGSDHLFAKYAKLIDREDIKCIMAIPREHQAKLYAEMERRGEPNVWAAIHAIAHPLDFNDVFKFEQAKADKKIGFILKRHDIDHVFTFDKKYHDKAVEDYERQQARKYGTGETERVEKAKKKKVESADTKKKSRQAKAEAAKSLKDKVVKFLEGTPSQAEIDKLGAEICERSLNADQCRRLWAAFGVKGVERINTYELRTKTWEKVFSMYIATGDVSELARLATLLRFPILDGK